MTLTRPGARFGALAAAALACACGAPMSQPAPGPDCSAGDAYDLVSPAIVDASILALGAPPLGHMPYFATYPYGDATPGSVTSWGAADVDPQLTCGHTRVLDIQSMRHNDYGSGFFMDLNGTAASQDDGIFFWARSPLAASDKSVTVVLADINTSVYGGRCVDASATAMVSANMNTPLAGTNASQTPNFQPGPLDCGYNFQTIITFNTLWTLYVLPFSVFAQLPKPTRNPNGVDPTMIFQLGLVIPKEANFEIWIDQIGVYKPKPAAAGP